MLGGVECLFGWGLVSEDLKCKRLDEPHGARLGDLTDLETNSADKPAPVDCVRQELGFVGKSATAPTGSLDDSQHCRATCWTWW